MGFGVNVYTPLAFETSSAPRQLIARLDNAVTGGNFDCDIQGGYVQANLTLRPGWLDTVPPGAHIEIRENGHLRWEGMRLRVRRNGPHLIGLECRGYGVGLTDCNPLQTAPLTAPFLDGASCIATAMQGAPLPGFIIGNPWQTPALYHALSEFDGQTPWQVMQQVTTGSGYDWQCWSSPDGVTQRTMTLTQRVTPSVGNADYQVPLEGCPNWEEDDSTIYTRITGKYTDATTNATALTQQYIDALAETRLGQSRATILNLGKTTNAYATSFVQTKLRTSVYPQVRAVISGPRLRRTKDIATPASQVRPGQWVQVGAPEEGRQPQIIVHTSVTWQGVGTFQLGAPPLDAVGAVVATQRVAAAVVVAANPLSGAPA